MGIGAISGGMTICRYHTDLRASRSPVVLSISTLPSASSWQRQEQARGALKAWLNEPLRCNTTALFPNIHGARLSPDAVRFLLSKYVKSACERCPSLKQKRITPHILRYTAAMELLQAGVDISVIALWLGHESIQTTQIYIGLKIAALAKLKALEPQRTARF